MGLNSVYHPGDALPQQIWVSWDCVECDNQCEAVIEEGGILQSHLFCYRCGAVCGLPYAILVETREYELGELLDDPGTEITFEPEDDDE